MSEKGRGETMKTEPHERTSVKATYEMPPEKLVIDETVPVDDRGEEYRPKGNSRAARYTPISRKEKP